MSTLPKVGAFTLFVSAFALACTFGTLYFNQEAALTEQERWNAMSTSDKRQEWATNCIAGRTSSNDDDVQALIPSTIAACVNSALALFPEEPIE